MSKEERERSLFDPLALPFEGRRGLVLTLLVVPLLVGVILWLPPFSLRERALGSSYREVLPGGAVLTADDGTELVIPADARRGALEVRLTSPSRESAQASRYLSTLPEYLAPSSPLYIASARGRMPAYSRWSIPLPGTLAPVRLLDLYGWDGQRWAWLAHDLDLEGERLVAEVAALPEALVLVEARRRPGEIRAELTGALPEGATPTVPSLLSPRLFLLQPEGRIGQLFEETGAVSGAARVIPVLHNVELSGTVLDEIVNDLLQDATLRTSHIDQIAALLEARGYGGIVIDYGAVSPERREDFTRFISDLAERLAGDSRIVGVRVGEPLLEGENILTGAYDWEALGRAAAFVQVPLPRGASGRGAGLERLLDFATGKIDRYKVEWELPVTTYRLQEGEVYPVPYRDIVALLAEATGINEEELFFLEDPFLRTLPVLEASGRATLDAETFTYRLEVGSEPLYVAEVENLARLLEMLRSYQIGNVVAPDANAVAPRWWELLATYRELGSLP